MTGRPYLSRALCGLLVGCVSAAGLWSGVAQAAPVDADAGQDTGRGTGDGTGGGTAPGVYLVVLQTPPAAVYDGGRAGLRATRPAAGVRFDRTRPAVVAYQEGLVDRQDRVLRRIGQPPVLYRYTTALDGFAATLDTGQVQRLREMPGVRRVERSTRQQLDRVSSAGATTQARLPGVSGREGLWARAGGPARAGRGVVVGVVDSGIWPGNPSFASLPDRTPGTAGTLPGFHGECAAAERWTAEDCSDKIVSARWFVAGFGQENAAAAEYLSPRDGSGHGSHVASTAAGDDDVRVRIDGQGFGRLSGMAPAARLAVYKACWTAPDPADDGCTTADTVAAVDRAVADGVDVLTYSVSGSTVRDDAVELAFLGAASAGVFVAASAGNDGPGPGTVGHVAPWVTTVGAATDDEFAGTVRLAGGASYPGSMVSSRPGPRARIVLAEDVAAPGVSWAAARHCAQGSLDTDEAEGTIVVCDRGAGARVAKSAAVESAGGVGMVLANTRVQGVEADVHAVPTVHLRRVPADALKAVLRRPGAARTASLEPVADRSRRASIAAFSARGPARVAGAGVLKPDLTAPGVSVLGAVAPPSDSGRSWDLVSGTSTSAPHVAGLAAVVAGVHRTWSPARIRSAMMTTATDLAGPQGPLVQGAGLVDPTRLLDPGLVFDTDPAAWNRIVHGRSRARAVNAPSVAVGDLRRPTTVTRRVTNVGQRRAAYSVRVKSLPGVDVQAFPATVRLSPGQTGTVRLRVTARPGAARDRVSTGWLLWRSDRHTVRIPVSARPRG